MYLKVKGEINIFQLHFLLNKNSFALFRRTSIGMSFWGNRRVGSDDSVLLMVMCSW